jgi:hypothetical protein
VILGVKRLYLGIKRLLPGEASKRLPYLCVYLTLMMTWL